MLPRHLILHDGKGGCVPDQTKQGWQLMLLSLWKNKNLDQKYQW